MQTTPRRVDENAIKVLGNSKLIGYVPAIETDVVHKILDSDHKSFIESIIEFDDDLDVTIKVYYN